MKKIFKKILIYFKNHYKNGFNQIYNYIIFKYRRVELLGEINIRGRIVCMASPSSTIRIGKGVRINSAKWANMIGGDCRTIITASEDAEIIIGNNVAISNSAIVARKRIIIEDNVMIGGNCRIYDTDFHSLKFKYRSEGFEDIKDLPVTIKNGAFIGAHSIILKGVTIGSKSIVGAASVVTKNIPDGEIWAGNPAKYIRKID